MNDTRKKHMRIMPMRLLRPGLAMALLVVSVPQAATYLELSKGDMTLTIDESGNVVTNVPVLGNAGSPPTAANNDFAISRASANVLVAKETQVTVENGTAEHVITSGANGDLVFRTGTDPNAPVQALLGTQGSFDGVLGAAGHISCPGVPTNTVLYIDGAGVFEQAGAAAPLQFAYANLPGGEGRTVYSDAGSSNYYYVKDHLGSTRVVYDENGTAVERTAYLAYGTMNVVGGSSADPAREKFTGKEFDQDGAANGVEGTMLAYFGARYYDPQTACWTGPDPKDQVWNAYGYCAGNPVALVDPNGEAIGFVAGLLITAFLDYIGCSIQNQTHGMDDGWNLFTSEWWKGDPDHPGTGALNILNFSVGGSATFAGTATGVGYRANLWVSEDVGALTAYAAFSVYNFGMGTTSADAGKTSYDITVGYYATAGAGSGSSMNTYALNYDTRVGTNDNAWALTYGQFWNYNSGTGEGTIQGMFSCRSPNIALYYHNDSRRVLSWGGGTDQGWTGGGGIAARDGAGDVNELMTDCFTGTRSAGHRDIGSHEYWKQSDYMQSLNRANTVLRINGGVPTSMTKTPWSQDYIHCHVTPQPMFRYYDQEFAAWYYKGN
jgi:RHS repeat-associated protein